MNIYNATDEALMYGANLAKQYEEEKDDPKRSFIDRVFSPLANESVTSAIYNLTDGDKSTSMTEGLVAGASKQINPFKNDVSDSKTFADVLTDNFGWQPESVLGKTAKFATGLAGDIILDPMTYLTGGLSAVGKVAKGTGKVMKTGYKVGDSVKNVSLLTSQEADKIIFNSLENTRPTPTNIKLKHEESASLVKHVNEKVLKTYDTERMAKENGLSIGFNQIPFATKIKIGDKKLAEFQKQLISSRQFREFGDKTVAPMVNKVMTDVRNSKLGSKFNKYAIEERVMGTDKWKGSSLAKMISITNNSDGFKAKRNEKAYNRYTEYADMIDEFDQTKLLKAFNIIESGEYQDALQFNKLKDAFNKDNISNNYDRLLYEVERLKGTKRYKQLEELRNSNQRLSEHLGTDTKTGLDASITKALDFVKDVSDDTDFGDFQRRVTKAINTLDDETLSILFSRENDAYSNLLSNYKKHLDTSNKTLGEYIKINKKYGNETRDIVDIDLKKEAELLQRLDDDTIKFIEMFTKDMREIGADELPLKVIAKDQLFGFEDKYIPHIITPEANKILDTWQASDKDALTKGYNPMFARVSKVGSRVTDKTIQEANEDFMQQYGVKLFEDNVADIYLARQIKSNNRINSKENMAFLKNNILKTQADLFNDKNVYVFDEVQDKFNSLISRMIKSNNYEVDADDFQKIRREMYEFLDFDELVGTNMPIIDNPITVSKLNELFSPDKFDANSLGLFTTKMADLVEKGGTYIPGNKAIHLDGDKPNFIANFINSGGQQSTLKTVFTKNRSPIGRYTDDGVINRVNKLSFAQEQELKNDFLKVYDLLTQKFKQFKTIYNPGFIPQNVVGNEISSWLANADTLLNPKIQATAMKILKQETPSAKMKIGNKEYRHDVLLKMANDYGVTENIFTQELESLDKLSKNKHIAKAQVGIKKVEDKLLSASAKTEGHARLSLFINELNSGKTPYEASETVKRFLFVYDDITDFEKNVMRRVIPFYTWMKKNSGLQAKEMIEQSSKFALIDKTLNSLDESIVNDDRDVYDETSRIQINDNFAINPNLPTDQMEKISTPGRIFSAANPMIKLPYQFITDKNTFNGDSMDTEDHMRAVASLAPHFMTQGYNLATSDEELKTRMTYLLGEVIGHPIGKSY